MSGLNETGQMEKAIDRGDVTEAKKMRDIRDAYSRRIMTGVAVPSIIQVR
jgi:hypothetical protein